MSAKPKSIFDIHPDAWAEVVEDVLWGFTTEKRIEILKIALANAQWEAADDENWHRDHPQYGGLRWTCASEYLEEHYQQSAGHVFWNAIMRINAAVAYTLIRVVTNNNSPETARKLLLSCHHNSPGSGYLEEYLDGILPRPKRKAREEA